MSVFGVRGDRLSLRQVIGSGGVFPVSVATHNGLVDVLNALAGGTVQGYFSFFGHLLPIPGIDPVPGPDHSLGHHPVHQHARTGRLLPDGSRLIVTTKLNLSAIDVFRLRPLRVAVAKAGGKIRSQVPAPSASPFIPAATW